MKKIRKVIFSGFSPLCLVAVVASSTCVNAQHFIYESAQRFINAGGWIERSPSPATNYFDEAFPASEFSEFHGVVSGEVREITGAGTSNPDTVGSSASCRQDSVFSSDKLTFSSELGLSGWISLYGNSGSSFAAGRSYFETSFRVSSVAQWTLAFDGTQPGDVRGPFASPYGGIPWAWDLVSAKYGLLAGGPFVSNLSEWNQPKSGTMEPDDTYILRYEINGWLNSGDPLGDYGSPFIGSSLTLVPEPTAFSLLSLSVLTAIVLKRKK